MGRGSTPNYNIPQPVIVVDKATQRRLTSAMVGLVASWFVILALVVTLGFLYTEIQIAKGSNTYKDKRIQALKHQYEQVCRKED